MENLKNLKGNVENISAQTNACQIDGIWYTLGPNVRLQYVKKGLVEYSVQQTPNGQNDLVVFIKSIGQTPQAPQIAQPGAPMQAPAPMPAQPRPTDEGMKRMSALKASSRIYEGTAQEDDFKILTNEVVSFIETGVWIEKVSQ